VTGATGATGAAGSANISGTTNYVVKFTGTTTGGNSQLFDNGTNVGIGTTGPSDKLEVIGASNKGVKIGSTAGSFDNTSYNPDISTLGAVISFQTGADTTYRQSIYGYQDASANAKLGIFSRSDLVFLVYKGLTTDSRAMVIKETTGNVGINNTSPGAKLQIDTGGAATKGFIVKGFTSQSANLQEWQSSAGTVLAYMDASGNFFAVSKSFLIDHPTKPGKKLNYASLEGPDHAVYFRGTVNDSDVIILPEYWLELVDPDSVTVVLTSRKYPQPNLYVEDSNNVRVILRSDRAICCDFVVYGTRKDIAKLEAEPDGE
jgi:hypothetical protein